MCKETYAAVDITTGSHPEGFRIDKTASAMNRYTKWTINESGEWVNPQPVCFHSMPETGWEKVDHFDWGDET